MNGIVTAQSGDAGWIADVIGAAFHELAPSVWLVPDPVERARILPRNFRIFVDYALEHGEVHATPDRSAVAVWIPRIHELPPPDDYERRLVEACGAYTSRFQELDALFDRFHPEQPHQHLAFLAVRKDRQGAGLGSQLLQWQHRRFDADGVAAYLEASSPGSRELYRRHGYQPHGEPFTLGTDGHFWPMWRNPSSAMGT